jgi:hypothetical protein
MNCNHCAGTGIVNSDQVPDDVMSEGAIAARDWIREMNGRAKEISCSCHTSPPCYRCVEYLTDAKVCNCCGNGNEWYGVPGQHYSASDPKGNTGPYDYNGGLAECH